MSGSRSDARDGARQPSAAAEEMLRIIVDEARACAHLTGRPTISSRILQAMREVPRSEFVPPSLAGEAWADAALPIGHGQTISQPFIVALMTELADIGPSDVVLEIGTGSGYQAALLSRLAAEVHSIEVVPELADAARRRLLQLGYEVAVHAGDGRAGHGAAAPYDAILVTAASLDVPPALVEQLRAGGRLVIPLGRIGGVQRLTRGVKRVDGTLELRDCLDVRFVPLIAASGPASV